MLPRSVTGSVKQAILFLAPRSYLRPTFKPSEEHLQNLTVFPSCSRSYATASPSADVTKRTAESSELEKQEEEDEEVESKSQIILNQFFDSPINVKRSGKLSVGRSWSVDELRGKSHSDLHKLWFILIVERNMLKTMEAIYERDGTLAMPGPQRIFRVEESMENIETVISERNRAVLELEGSPFERPTKTVTSPIGFRVKKELQEHILPSHMNPEVKKEYEQPDLDEQTDMFQKIWKEKEWKVRRDREDDKNRAHGNLRRIYQY